MHTLNHNKELQNNEFILPGNLGTVQVAGENEARDIKAVNKSNDGSVTLTIGPAKFIAMKDGGFMDADEWMNTPVEKTEDADFQIIEPKQLTNE